MASSSADGSWLGRLVMASPVGQWSMAGLMVRLVWLAGMAGLSASFLYDDLALNERAELVPAVVVRTNYDQRSESFNAELQAPYQGLRVLVEDIHQRPLTGEVLTLEVDPQKPTRVRDPQSLHGSPLDWFLIALVPVGLVIAWAHVRRRLRRRASR
ncbi:hypothetical protein ACIA49_37405 [Kribbella sp. NPDC051587]|uniref:hypothetical protein n=1 Tax=Kribbella sp. NPDC051587 TaxID=3364119 RepID=UPI0037BDA0F0